MIRYIKKFFAILVAIAIYLLIFQNSISFAGTITNNIDGINESKYPGVKSLIKNLQSKHSNYEFKVYYTGIDWTEAITREYQGHGGSPKNLFNAAKNYKGKWYCPICGSKTYDTGWYCASIDAIKYMMDPRNSLDEVSVYQFKNLETPDVNANNIKTVINKKYSSYSYINNQTAINAIVNASSTYNLNGYSILAKIVNEQGKGTSPLVTGAGYNGQYVGYYNFFNVGAYGNGTSTVITNGLKYAKNQGWNSVQNSILGGANYYKSSYIGKGQNTLHYQRFNVVYTTSLFSHQYQQDIMGAQTGGTLLYNYYVASSTVASVKHTFIIPLYENMPATPCARPSTTENSTLRYEDGTVKTNKIPVRAAPATGSIIAYLNTNEKVKVLEQASKTSSDGKYWDVIVTNTDGTYGYVERSGISYSSNAQIAASNSASATMSEGTYLFDATYYMNKYGDLKKAYGANEKALYEHFVKYGASEGRSPSPVLDLKYYVANNGDLKNAFGTDYAAAYEHFKNYGCLEYRKSAENYDPAFYRYFNSNLSGYTSKQLLEYYMSKGRKNGDIAALPADVESILFDSDVYYSLYADIRNVIGNNKTKLRKHWLEYGIKEGRAASYMFDPKVYLEVNPDLQQAYGNNYLAGFKHFLNYGIKEGRATSIIFDVTKYLEKNGDLKAAYKTDYKSAYKHFINYGIKEGRVTSLVFDVRAYVNMASDIKAAFGTNYNAAYKHFLIYGMEEGRRTIATFNVRTYRSSNTDLSTVCGNNYRNYFIHYIAYGKTQGRKCV